MQLAAFFRGLFTYTDIVQVKVTSSIEEIMKYSSFIFTSDWVAVGQQRGSASLLVTTELPRCPPHTEASAS